MEEVNRAFDEYMAEVKKLDINGKREEVLSSVKEIILAFETLAQNDDIELNFLKSSEVNDLRSDNVSEDDYLEGLLVYIEVAKNMIGEYLDKKDI